MPRFKGKPVVLGGVEYIAPPMGMEAVVELKERIDALDGGNEKTLVSVGLDLIHASLSRNYPELTRAEIGVMVEIGEFQPAFDTVMKISGLTKKPSGDGGSEGNAPGAASATSTGTASTPDSAAPSAGPGNTSTST